MHYTSEPDGTIDPANAKNLRGKGITEFFNSKRFYVVALLFLGNMNVSLLGMNLNIAIVEMTSKKRVITENMITFKEPDFGWNSKTIGVIESASAYGCLFCAVGVPMVQKFGGAVTVGVSVMGMAILNVMTPRTLEANFFIFFASRILIGIFDGIAFMAILEMLTRWVPVPERSTMTSFCFCGTYIGIAITYPVCGFIADRWDWQAVFYTLGSVGVIWSSIWLLVVKNQPSNDKRVSKEELQYLLETTETTHRKQVAHPYKEIFTSSAVWAMVAGKLAYGWGFSLMVVCFPLYIKDTTGLRTDEVGLLASIPNIICIFTTPLTGFILDYGQNISGANITQVHKTVISTGFISCCIFFMIASSSASFTISMICFVCIRLVLSINHLILQLVSLYMSPTHTTVLAGIGTIAYTLGDIVIPTVVGFMVQNHNLDEWSKCFRLSGAVLLVGALIFYAYGSSELQPWSTPTISDARENEKSKNENKIPYED